MELYIERHANELPRVAYYQVPKADAGLIPKMGIELAPRLTHLVGDYQVAQLVRLSEGGAGFRAFPQEFAAVLRR